MKRIACMVAWLVSAGCAQVVQERGGGAAGARVTTEDKSLSWLPGLGETPGFETWTRVRVFASAGATRCRSVALLQPDNPLPESRPDGDGVAMLTVKSGAGLHIVCDTPGGKAERRIRPYVHVSEVTSNGRKLSSRHPVVPLLVHMDRRDPQAEARWAALRAELCTPERSALIECLPGVLEQLKARDIDGP